MIRYVCVSSGRPYRVADVERLVPEVVWYVPSSQIPDYGDATRPVVPVPDPPSKSRQLNAAIDDALADGAAWLVTLDDDVAGFYRWLPPYVPVPDPIGLDDFVAGLVDVADRTGLDVAVPLQTTVGPWRKPPVVATSGAMIGQFVAHRVDPTIERYDETMDGIEDVDYGLTQHLTRGGVAFRRDLYAKTPRQSDRPRPGGYTDFDRFVEAASRFEAKWAQLGVQCPLDNYGRPSPRVRWASLAARVGA